MKKLFTTFITLLLIFTSVYADKVDQIEAKKIAVTFYSNYAPANKAESPVEKIITEYYQDLESFYIFGFKYGGFVIVSADDNAYPILGYSFNSPISETINSNTRYLFNKYKKEIEDVKKLKLKDNKIETKWDQLRDSKMAGEIKAAGPLLETTWDQSPLYNEYCPTGTPTGCVATAMSQIMNYHEWPKSGNGWHKYIPEDHPEYGVQYADFTSVEYKWANMPNELSGSSSSDEIDAVATICYHAGISVNMNYTTDGSGASSSDVLYALTSYFKYDPNSIEFITYNSDNEDVYMEKIKNEIDNGRPIYYDGYKDNSGHAWVCDGYDDNNKVHINWGWAGAYNGYFLLSDMTPGYYDFSEGNAMIIGIQPGSIAQDVLWTKQASGFATASRGIQHISAVNNRTAWAIAYDGSGGGAEIKEFTRTTDGSNWTYGTINATGTNGYSPSMITAIDENTAWVALYDGTNGGGKVVKTSDGGQSWEVQSTATFSAPNGFPNVIHFWDENNGWCQGDPNDDYFEFYTTTDGGSTWTRVPEGNIPASLDGEYGRVSHMAVYGNNIWFATNKGRIYKSTDKGNNWTVVQLPFNNSSFETSFRDENNGIILTTDLDDNLIYKTSDGGATWSQVNYSGNLYFNDITYIPNTNILISTGSDYETPAQGVSYSTDDGATFTDYADFYRNFQFLCIGAASEHAIWAGGFNSDENNDGMWHYGQILDTVDFSLNDREFCLNDSSVVFTDVSLDSYDTYEWYFGEGASPATASGIGPHTVKYTSSGSKNIKLKVIKSAIEDSVIHNNMVYIASEVPSIGTITGNTEVTVFNSELYSVDNLDEVNYSWNLPTDWNGNSTNNNINVTFMSPGTETIIVTPSNVCGDGTPASLEITASCATSNPGEISGESEVTVGETHSYTVPEQKNISFIWELPIDWTGSSTLNSIDVTFGGEAAVDSIKVTSTSSVCGDGESTYFKITVSESSTGVDDLNESLINIYPNPAKNNIIITGIDNANIYIYNTSGTLVRKIDYLENNTPIDISNLNSGLYYISIIQDNNTITKSISIIK